MRLVDFFDEGQKSATNGAFLPLGEDYGNHSHLSHLSHVDRSVAGIVINAVVQNPNLKKLAAKYLPKGVGGQVIFKDILKKQIGSHVSRDTGTGLDDIIEYAIHSLLNDYWDIIDNSHNSGETWGTKLKSMMPHFNHDHPSFTRSSFGEPSFTQSHKYESFDRNIIENVKLPPKPTRQSITAAILQGIEDFTNRGAIKCVRDIGDGHCYNFAWHVLNLLGYDPHTEGQWGLRTKATEEYWRDDFEASIPMMKRAGEPVPVDIPKKVFEELIGSATHEWLYWRGLHFDATAPQGVKHFLELPFFAQQIEGLRKELKQSRKYKKNVTESAGQLIAVSNFMMKFAKAHHVEMIIKPKPNYDFPPHSLLMTDLFADQPGQGNGTIVMNRLCEIADGIQVNVYTHPDGPRSKAFYERFGFKMTNNRYDTVEMVRYPTSDPDQEREDNYDPRDRSDVTEAYDDKFASQLNDFAQHVKSQFGLQELSLYPYFDKIKIGSIAVPKGLRKEKRGSGALQAICDFADDLGKTIILTPAQKDDHWGTTSQNRLFRFYGRFGFVRNMGRNKDFTTTELMYRKPKGRRVTESTDKIDQLIKNSKYSNIDIEDATTGQCGAFALALHHYLQRHNITSELVWFYEADSFGVNDVPYWHHVAVKVGNNYYDIRGLISPDEAHKEFNTDLIAPVSEAVLIAQLRLANKHSQLHYHRRIRDKFGKRFPESPMTENRMILNSPEFKAWFQGSQIVDSHGEPLKVYHGTRSDVQSFNPSRGGEYGPGIYLSSDSGTAHFYADNVAQGPEGSNIMPLYVSMKKPFRVTKLRWIEMTKSRTPREVQKRLISRGYDGIIGTGINGHEQQIVAFSPDQVRSAISD